MIRDLLARAEAELRAAGIEEPRADAERVLAGLLRTDRVRLRLRDAEPVPPDAEAEFLSRVRRRAAREPIQYLNGRCEFHGLEFRVTRDVLIPRPETEGIVDALLAGAAGLGPVPTIADVGTGSGCLAVTLAMRLPAARVIAVDVSAAALGVARANAQAHGVAARIDFRHGDGVGPLEGEWLDALVSNPPYVTDAEFADLSTEVREYEPALALRGGADGLDVVRALIAGAPRVLRPGGRLFLEIGWRQADAVRALFGRDLFGAGWRDVRLHRDLQGIERIVEAVNESRG